MLAERGMRVVLLLSQPSPQIEHWTQSTDAVVIGTASRSIDPLEACSGVREKRLHCSIRHGPRSSPLSIAVHSIPLLRETSVHGLTQPWMRQERSSRLHCRLSREWPDNLYKPLTLAAVAAEIVESRNHPLNPMTNSNLVTHLQSQTKRRVGLLSCPEVQQGP